MRKVRKGETVSKYRILAVDDEAGVIESLIVVFRRAGYDISGTTDPLQAIELIRNEHFDLLILDFLMTPIHGDKVVEQIRAFNTDLYILLLTGYKDLAPPLDTIRSLDIQGYCEKSDRFDQLVLLVESGIKSITQMNTIRVFKDGLNKILQSVPKIYQLQPIGSILEDILSEILLIINSRDAFIIIDDLRVGQNGDGKNESIFRGIGRYHSEIGHFMHTLTPLLMEQIGTARTTSRNIRLDDGIILPLLDDNRRTLGVLYVACGPDAVENGLELVEIFASQAAASINNAFLHSMINTQNAELGRTYEMLKQRYMDTIEALRIVVDAKDEYTRGHSDRVSFFATRIGREFGLPDEELETLRIASLFHDIGKIGTADDILLKKDRLDQHEYNEVKKHPLKGAHILSAVSMFKDIVPLVRSHHERPDGKGYPDGLTADEIPFLAKIISVADAFDAMTSNRTYRIRMLVADAVSQLRLGAGHQFDPLIVETLIDLLADYNGLMEQMNSEINITNFYTTGEHGQMQLKEILALE